MKIDLNDEREQCDWGDRQCHVAPTRTFVHVGGERRAMCARHASLAARTYGHNTVEVRS